MSDQNIPQASATSPPSVVDRLKTSINMPSVQEQFKNCLADSAPLFVASLIDLYSSDSYLQQCEPKDVIMEALKAATLKLPINKQLGLAYVVPYQKQGGKFFPQMQIGYRGLIQLAMRTGQYKHINADLVYEGELKSVDKLTGEIDLSGEKISDKVIGYFAHMETLNGFRKTVYITKEGVEAHAKKFSKSYTSSKSPWKTNFDAMGIKTPIRHLFSKYAIMSIEMEQALTADNDERGPDDDFPPEANTGDIIDIESDVIETTDQTGPSF
jgi:recombination protein RecT